MLTASTAASSPRWHPEVIFGTLQQYGIAIDGFELPDSGISASVGVEVLEALRDGVRDKLLEEKADSALAGKLTVIDTWIASALDIEDRDTAIGLLAGAEIEHDKTFVDIKARIQGRDPAGR